MDRPRAVASAPRTVGVRVGEKRGFGGDRRDGLSERWHSASGITCIFLFDLVGLGRLVATIAIAVVIAVRVADAVIVTIVSM